MCEQQGRSHLQTADHTVKPTAPWFSYFSNYRVNSKVLYTNTHTRGQYTHTDGGTELFGTISSASSTGGMGIINNCMNILQYFIYL